MAERIGSILVRRRLITPVELDEALRAQLIYGGRLGTILVELDLLSLDDLADSLAEQLRYPIVSEEQLDGAPPAALKLLTAEQAQAHQAIPFSLEGRKVKMAMASPHDPAVQDALAFITGLRVIPFLVPELRLAFVLERRYGMKRKERFIRLAPERHQDKSSRRRGVAGPDLERTAPAQSRPAEEKDELFGRLNESQYLGAEEDEAPQELPGPAAREDALLSRIQAAALAVESEEQPELELLAEEEEAEAEAELSVEPASERREGVPVEWEDPSADRTAGPSPTPATAIGGAAPPRPTHSAPPILHAAAGAVGSSAAGSRGAPRIPVLARALPESREAAGGSTSPAAPVPVAGDSGAAASAHREEGALQAPAVSSGAGATAAAATSPSQGTPSAAASVAEPLPQPAASVGVPPPTGGVDVERTATQAGTVPGASNARDVGDDADVGSLQAGAPGVAPAARSIDKVESTSERLAPARAASRASSEPSASNRQVLGNGQGSTEAASSAAADGEAGVPGVPLSPAAPSPDVLPASASVQGPSAGVPGGAVARPGPHPPVPRPPPMRGHPYGYPPPPPYAYPRGGWAPPPPWGAPPPPPWAMPPPPTGWQQPGPGPQPVIRSRRPNDEDRLFDEDSLVQWTLRSDPYAVVEERPPAELEEAISRAHATRRSRPLSAEVVDRADIWEFLTWEDRAGAIEVEADGRPRDVPVRSSPWEHTEWSPVDPEAGLDLHTEHPITGPVSPWMAVGYPEGLIPTGEDPLAEPSAAGAAVEAKQPDVPAATAAGPFTMGTESSAPSAAKSGDIASAAATQKDAADEASSVAVAATKHVASAAELPSAEAAGTPETGAVRTSEGQPPAVQDSPPTAFAAAAESTPAQAFATTAAEAPAPSATPSEAPTMTAASSEAPATAVPSEATAIAAGPSEAPATAAPSEAPATAARSEASAIAAGPAEATATPAPSEAPATAAPSEATATAAPSEAPATAARSEAPATAAQSEAPAISAAPPEATAPATAAPSEATAIAAAPSESRATAAPSAATAITAGPSEASATAPASEATAIAAGPSEAPATAPAPSEAPAMTAATSEVPAIVAGPSEATAPTEPPSLRPPDGASAATATGANAEGTGTEVPVGSGEAASSSTTEATVTSASTAPSPSSARATDPSPVERPPEAAWFTAAPISPTPDARSPETLPSTEPEASPSPSTRGTGTADRLGLVAPSSVPPEDIRLQVEGAREPTEISAALLKYCQSRFGRAFVLVEHGGAASVWKGFGEGADDPELADVRLALDLPSALQTAASRGTLIRLEAPSGPVDEQLFAQLSPRSPYLVLAAVSCAGAPVAFVYAESELEPLTPDGEQEFQAVVDLAGRAHARLRAATSA